MAIYHLSVKSVSRSTGRSAVGAAAYRSATRLTCERDGVVHDYTRKQGVEASFVVTPEGAAWAQERAALWNAAEAAEKRRDAKVAREYELALPHELDPVERRELVAAFAGEVVNRFGVAADVAIHAPGREGDQRNWHAHVLTTTRVVGAEGLGAKTRALDVAQTAGPAVESLRETWAEQVNAALERARVRERVDHRSFARQGRAEEAEQHLGPGASALERKARRQALAAAAEASERSWEGRAGVEEGRAAPVPAPVPVPALAAEPRLKALAGAAGVPTPEWGQEPQGRALEAVSALAGGRERVEASEASKAVSVAPERPLAGERGANGAGQLRAEGVRVAPMPEPELAFAPVTRIGQHNAAVRERNRLLGVARAAWEAARSQVERLERAVVERRRWVLGLARGLGAQLAGEREAREREVERHREVQARAEAERRAALEREERARLAERERIAAELLRREAERASPATTQAQRDAARARPWDAEAYWKGLIEEGRRLGQAEQERAGQRRRQERERERSRDREGPSLGR